MEHDKPIALVYGVYDLTHYGHYRLFKGLFEDGYSVHVGIVSDAFVKSYKRTPMLNQDERLENVSHCKWVSDCFLSTGDFELEARRIVPAVIVHGSDWKDEEYMEHMGYTHEFFDEQGINLISKPYTEGVSTSSLIDRIKRR